MNIPRVKVQDYQGLGKKLYQMAKNQVGQNDLPTQDIKDISKENVLIQKVDKNDLAKYLNQGVSPADNVEIPAHVSTVLIVQGDDRSTLVIKLPPKEMLEDSSESAAAASPYPYPLPNFYREKIFQSPENPETGIDNKDILEMRVGDYSIQQCT